MMAARSQRSHIAALLIEFWLEFALALRGLGEEGDRTPDAQNQSDG